MGYSFERHPPLLMALPHFVTQNVEPSTIIHANKKNGITRTTASPRIALRNCPILVIPFLIVSLSLANALLRNYVP